MIYFIPLSLCECQNITHCFFSKCMKLFFSFSCGSSSSTHYVTLSLSLTSLFLCAQFRDFRSLCAYLCQYFTPYLSQTEWRYSISPLYFFFIFFFFSSLTLSTLPLSFSQRSLSLSLTLSLLKPNAASCLQGSNC